MSKYRIWKKSIQEYRVADQNGNIVYEGKNILAKNPKFIVDGDGYLKAKKRNFANTDNPFDYFAYIECEDFTINPSAPVVGYNKNIFFNPFKAPFFQERRTGREILEAISCFINGNRLYV